MIMQSYDFYTLYKKYGCNLQFGGDDQWANMIGGMELIRRKLQGNANAMTITLLVIFLIVKLVNKVMSLGKKTESEETPTTKKCPFCFSEIDIKATKCPHCTGDIIDLTEKTDDKK